MREPWIQVMLAVSAMLVGGAVTTAAQADAVRVELVADAATIAPGQRFWLGLRFRITPGWHIYWRNPGDSGQPPAATWELPRGFRAGEIRWPTPVRIGTGTVVDYGYEKDVLLLVPVDPPAGLEPRGEAVLAANVRWLMCKDICVPAKQRVELRLPAAQTARAASETVRAEFRKARAEVPRPAPATWRLTARMRADAFELELLTGQPPRRAQFFPLEPGQIENAAQQKLEPRERGARLILRKSDQMQKPPAKLRGVVVLDGRAYEIEARVVPQESSGVRSATLRE